MLLKIKKHTPNGDERFEFEKIPKASNALQYKHSKVTFLKGTFRFDTHERIILEGKKMEAIFLYFHDISVDDRH